MLYLLWGLINIGLFGFFIFVCFKATRFIREKIGLFASIVFIFGLLSFMGDRDNDDQYHESNSIETKKWEFNSNKGLINNKTTIIELEKTLVSNYYLGVGYGKDKETNLYIPILAYSSINGFTSGINWKPLSILINSTDDKKRFQYFVDGIVEWKLLGATIYIQPKSYTGFTLTE